MVSGTQKKPIFSLGAASKLGFGQSSMGLFNIQPKPTLELSKPLFSGLGNGNLSFSSKPLSLSSSPSGVGLGSLDKTSSNMFSSLRIPNLQTSNPLILGTKPPLMLVSKRAALMIVPKRASTSLPTIHFKPILKPVKPILKPFKPKWPVTPHWNPSVTIKPIIKPSTPTPVKPIPSLSTVQQTTATPVHDVVVKVQESARTMGSSSTSQLATVVDRLMAERKKRKLAKRATGTRATGSRRNTARYQPWNQRVSTLITYKPVPSTASARRTRNNKRSAGPVNYKPRAMGGFMQP